MPTLTVVYYVCDMSNNNICGGDYYLSLLFLAHIDVISTATVRMVSKQRFYNVVQLIGVIGVII